MLAKAEIFMEQAGDTAEYWLRKAVDSIDEIFGDGYAKKNPELVSGFMIAASNDQTAMYIRNLVIELNNIRSELDTLSISVQNI